MEFAESGANMAPIIPDFTAFHPGYFPFGQHILCGFCGIRVIGKVAFLTQTGQSIKIAFLYFEALELVKRNFRQPCQPSTGSPTPEAAPSQVVFSN
jgi:hypothetical protein